MNLEGKTALVTGASRRVGRAIALELARSGADVVVQCHTHRSEALETVAEIRKLGRAASVVEYDLRNNAAKLLEDFAAAGVPVDVLVNNAAVYRQEPLEQISEESWNETLDLNVKAPFLLARGLGQLMVRRGYGKIVNIGDAAVRRPYSNALPYLVSKNALHAVTQCLALELAPAVQVNTVAPGLVVPGEAPSSDYEAWVIKRTPLKRAGLAEDVAGLVRFLAEEGDFLTGGWYPVDGGANL